MNRNPPSPEAMVADAILGNGATSALTERWLAAVGTGVPAAVTQQRSFFIGTGLYLAGLRGRELVRGALFASSAVTAWIVADLAMKARGRSGLTPWSD